MSLFSTDSIKLFADSIGLVQLKEDVASLLCHDVEYRVREIIQEAAKFMRNSNRCKLTTEDIQYALKLKHLEPIYGYDPSEVGSFKQYATTVSHGNAPLYFREDKEVDFDSLLTSSNVPRVLLPVTFTSHWLAIEGVQPQIPENPVIHSLSSSNLAKASVMHDPQRPLQDNITDASGANYTVVKHHLSKEHQMYYETVTSCLFSKDENAVMTALSSLRHDAGLQQLLPYFIQFISEMIMKHLRQLSYLILLQKVIASLLSNSSLFIEPYLHQLMPTLLTCVVGKRLGESNEDDHWSLREEASRLIRLICGKYGDAYPNLQPRVLKTLLKALIGSSPTLGSNSTVTAPVTPPVTLASLPSKYGALVCLLTLGNEPIDLFLMPNLRQCYASITIPVPPGRASASNTVLPLEIQKCHSAFLRAVGTFLKSKWADYPAAAQKDKIDAVSSFIALYSDAFEILGKKQLSDFIGLPTSDDPMEH